MCGIDVVVNYTSHIPSVPSSIAVESPLVSSHAADSSRRHVVEHRGPDFHDGFRLESEHFQLDMFGSVLQIQGDTLFRQPAMSSSGQSVLLWNGEYLNHTGSPESDTKLVLERLESSRSVLTALDDVEGPFAFVYFDKSSNRLWFGKDKQGRRSLLFRLNTANKELVISSCGLSAGVEVPAGRHIYCIDLDSMCIEEHAWPTMIPFTSSNFLSLANTGIPQPAALYEKMRSGIGKHMQATSVRAPLGILFSGGVDSAILAIIAAEVFLSSDHNLSHIDLINVATASTASPDRSTGLVTYAELLDQVPRNIFRFICVDIEPSEVAENQKHIMQLAAPNNTHMDFNISSALWFGGRAKGRVLEPSFVNDPQWPILRDQIVMHESVTSAMDNRRPKREKNISASISCTHCERRKTKPGCEYVACKICCLKADTSKTCPAHTAYVDPDSLIEKVSVSEFLLPYLSAESVESSCRILLVGHGADELFGGYGRHETRSQRGGLEALRNEMLLDLSRLWSRNLGRDDRVLADHARDTRHPFLDEEVVAYVGSLNAGAMASEDGGNKPLLRKMARDVLGLKHAPNFRKRAIQFGTRLAQQTNIAVHGSHSKGSGSDLFSLN